MPINSFRGQIWSLFPLIVVVLISVAPATATSERVFERLIALGFCSTVARAISDQRPDLHGGILSELDRDVDPASSKYRPVTLYRGLDTPIENYDSINGRGRTLVADQARWMSTHLEIARFYAGAVGDIGGRKPKGFLNHGILLEAEVPLALLTDGVATATRLSLAAAPDESIFIRRLGLVYFRLQQAGAGLDHTAIAKAKGQLPPLLTWFAPEEILEGGRGELPAWARGCTAALHRLTPELPRTNPHF